ncbi:RING-H2 finger protein ATL72-like [Hordeum vulgare]|nr:RING-H2 finger protein ATL72-like [Hordeum vulgare]
MDMGDMHASARRLLSRAAATPAVAVASPGPSGQTTPPSSPFGSVDATVISVLSLLLCVLVVALVVRALVQCACRVTRRVCYGQAEHPGDAEASGLEMAALRAGAGGKKKRDGKGAAIRAIPTMEYSAEIELAVCCSTECAICLADLKQGERVRVLPRCHHGFHVRCIDRWLSARQTCPTCRQEPFAAEARPEEPAPASAAVQVHVDAAQLETI